MTYELTQADIDAYLDSKQDDEVIGITCHGNKCLVAEVLKAKYGTSRVLVALGEAWVRDEKVAATDLTSNLHSLYILFDELNPSDGLLEHKVTKREWLAKLAEVEI